jgi:hypothetical protein
MAQSNQPHVVTVNIAEHTLMFLQTFHDQGLIEGSSSEGTARLNPNLRQLVDVMYHVLAGGTVKSIDYTPGNQQIVDRLKQMEDECTGDVNAINSRNQFPLVMEL